MTHKNKFTVCIKSIRVKTWVKFTKHLIVLLWNIKILNYLFVCSGDRDHDEDFSVADSARRLNQVKGLKGLGRYFKQIAQSARRPHSESNPATDTLDDFLGTVDIPIAVRPCPYCGPIH